MAGSKYSDIPVTNPDTATADMLGRENESRKRLADIEAGLSHPNLTAHEIMGLATQAALDAHAASLHDQGGVVPADYLLIRSGTTYSLIDGRSQAEVGNGTEPGALMQNAITAMGVRAGEVALTGREDFVWGSIPRVPPEITGRLRIRSTGPVVSLTSAGSRFLDPADTPAGGTIRRVSLENLDIDAAGAAAVDVTQHLIFGSYRGTAGNQSRINYEDIAFRRCRVVGAYSGTGNQHRPIFFTVQHDAAALPRNVMQRILVDECEFEGGLQGISLVGTKFEPAPWTGDADVFVDAVWIRGGRHVIPGAPQAFAASSHVHIGSGAQVGTVSVDNFYGYGSRDVGIEINNAQDATVSDCTMEDVFGHYFYTTNFRPLLRPNEAVSRNINCTARSKSGMKSDPSSSSFVCARTQSATAPALGRFLCSGFNGHSTRPDLRADGSLSGEALRLEGQFVGGAEIERFAFLHEGIDHADVTATDYTAAEVMVTNDTRVDIDGLKLRTVGTRQTTAGTLTNFLLKVRRGQVVVNWERLDLSSDIANMTDFNLRLLDLGMEDGSSIRGTINLHGRSANIANPRGILLGGAGMTVPYLKLVKCDFSGLSGGADVLFSGDSHKGAVEFDRCIWRTTAQDPHRWRVVGAAGEPAFTSPWRAFTGFQVPRFRKVGNLVYLDGVLGHDGAVNASTAFVLPVGYRPPAAVIPYGLARLDVDASGNVICRNVGTGSFHPLTCSFWVD